MGLVWDSESIAFGGVDTSKPPRVYTYQTEEFCPICSNPKTLVMPLRKLKTHLEKKSMIFLIEHLTKNNLIKFTVKELIASLNAENITDGDLLRKNLVILVSLGYFIKVNEEFQNEKGKKILRYLFKKNEIVAIPSCYDSFKDKHKIVEWERKTIFDSKANKKDDTQST